MVNRETPYCDLDTVIKNAIRNSRPFSKRHFVDPYRLTVDAISLDLGGHFRLSNRTGAFQDNQQRSGTMEPPLANSELNSRNCEDVLAFLEGRAGQDVLVVQVHSVENDSFENVVEAVDKPLSHLADRSR